MQAVESSNQRDRAHIVVISTSSTSGVIVFYARVADPLPPRRVDGHQPPRRHQRVPAEPPPSTPPAQVTYACSIILGQRHRHVEPDEQQQAADEERHENGRADGLLRSDSRPGAWRCGAACFPALAVQAAADDLLLAVVKVKQGSDKNSRRCRGNFLIRRVVAYSCRDFPGFT